LRPYRLVDRYSNFGKKHIVSIFKAEVVMPWSRGIAASHMKMDVFLWNTRIYVPVHGIKIHILFWVFRNVLENSKIICMILCFLRYCLLSLWSRSLSKEYLRIQPIPQREHHTFHYSNQFIDTVWENNPCLPWESYETHKYKIQHPDW
jgi:hypothetical protein